MTQKPCPFCGSLRVGVHEEIRVVRDRACVRCADCLSQGPWVDWMANTTQTHSRAWSLWNERFEVTR